jgi:geranylgeranyl diphosphate synthase type II
MAMDLKLYLKEKKETVDSFFRDYFKEKRRPAVLQEAMLYSLFAGGKRVRPVLAMAAYEACGGDARDIVPYASSLELIHTYSLIHDDLPAMDDDDLRRGKATNHKVYGEAVAILAGDALLTEAFCILSDPAHCRKVREGDLLKASKEIAAAAGYEGMVAGQVQDILSEDAEADEETLQFIHRHKTAALIRASVKVGGILFGGTAEKVDALALYGENIGHAFQVIDDILDVEGDAQVLGKPVGSDEKINKMTYPRLYGLEKSREIAKKLVDDAVSSLDAFSSGADPLREIARYLLERRN